MKLALLTGVGREGQVGEAVAARLAAEHYELVLVDRSHAGVTARADSIRRAGGTASAFSADLADPEAVAALIEDVVAKHGRALDAVIHLAGGFAVTGPVAESQVADWDRQLTINLRTAFLVARATVPLLRERSGSLIFFASESALPGAKVAGISAYAVAKQGVIALAGAISQEEARAGVRANVLAPGSIRTASNSASMAPDARFVEREEVAATVSWLCSDASRAVTGQVLRLSPR